MNTGWKAEKEPEPSLASTEETHERRTIEKTGNQDQEGWTFA